jgi:arylformamidase
VIIDITLPLKDGVPVWPGDTPYSFELNWKKEDTGSVNVGAISMSTHTGTHIDAPYHFNENGAKVKNLDLNIYVGSTTVVEVMNQKVITPDNLHAFPLERNTRLLIKTNSWSKRNKFPKEIPFFSPEIGPYLASKGIRLVGVDTPSVDPLDSKELPTHHSLNNNGVYILEGIVLDYVEPGEYELIALPLYLEEADASPVRAILRR